MNTIESTDMNDSLLVVDSVFCGETDADQVIAEIRMGGHSLVVVLDFGNTELPLIEYIKMPALLGSHPPSQKAVLEVMGLCHAGQRIECPLDLSHKVRNTDPPFPFTNNAMRRP